MRLMNIKREKGFTLIEILLVLAILTVLFTIVLIAINPAKQFANANNTKRSSDVNAILNALDQYLVDNKGSLPANMPAAGATAQTIGTGAGKADLCAALIPTYVAAFPQDPNLNGGAAITNCSSYNTGYTASVSATDNRITITAPNAQLGVSISVTR